MENILNRKKHALRVSPVRVRVRIFVSKLTNTHFAFAQYKATESVTL
jgi:hypothetical protein